jgi:hypothetical protein
MKARIKDGHLFKNHCWREWGLGMIANDPNVTMSERMAFARHSNPSSHIAYIRAGHNSDFAFQKAVSGAPMPKKKQIVAKHAAVVSIEKKKNCLSVWKKVSSSSLKVICKKLLPPFMKAPPKSLESHAQKARSIKTIIRGVATHASVAAAAVRRSPRMPKPKINHD